MVYKHKMNWANDQLRCKFDARGATSSRSRSGGTSCGLTSYELLAAGFVQRYVGTLLLEGWETTYRWQ